jgi:hypothetical protein
VAWDVQQRDETSSGAVVFDVPARRRVRALYTPQRIDCSYRFSDIGVTSHGGIGVIEVAQQSGIYPSPPTYRVRKRDAHGAAVLDSGPDIDSRSLASSNGTLYWTRAGAAHSAQVD